jgi:hypothetical protein
MGEIGIFYAWSASARMEAHMMTGPSKYGLAVRDLFQRDHPSLLDRLTGGVAVRQVLNVDLAA